MEKTKFKSTFEKLLAKQPNSVPGKTDEIEMVGNVKPYNDHSNSSIFNLNEINNLNMDQSVTPG